ncbi:MAG: HAMP domain-containing histidine kinase [Phycisphaerales bacterium]|nr:HAMP domain-containing histidine kinase [Phycisphaerales bacterium]
MSNLLDGSLRWLGLAHRTIDQARNPSSGNDLPAEDALDQASWQIETARGALERMADLVHAAMQSAGLPLGSRLLTNAEPVGLLDALSHAARVIAPEAADKGITVHVDVAPELRSTPAGALYAVILNALRNSLESISLAQHCTPGGRIEVLAASAGAVPGGAGMFIIEVRDDGVGPPPIDRPDRVFDPGFSTKQGGSGIGLSMASSLVRESGGTIRLLRRTEATPGQLIDPRRPGAVLRIVMPDRAQDMDTVLGQERRRGGDANAA